MQVPLCAQGACVMRWGLGAGLGAIPAVGISGTRCVGEETGMCVGYMVLSLPHEELHTHSHVCYAHTWPRTRMGSEQCPSLPWAPWGAWPHWGPWHSPAVVLSDFYSIMLREELERQEPEQASGLSLLPSFACAWGLM